MPIISGFWAGIYAYDNYPAGNVAFDAELLQTGKLLSGHITEDNSFADGAGALLQAVINGRVRGANIRFTKTYMSGPGANHAVNYKGEISKDGSQINGVWQVQELTGTFVMTRDAQSQKIKAKTAEPVTVK